MVIPYARIGYAITKKQEAVFLAHGRVGAEGRQNVDLASRGDEEFVQLGRDLAGPRMQSRVIGRHEQNPFGRPPEDFLIGDLSDEDTQLIGGDHAVDGSFGHQEVRARSPKRLR